MALPSSNNAAQSAMTITAKSVEKELCVSSCQGPKLACTLFVGNLSSFCSEDAIAKLFSTYAHVESVKIMMGQNTKSPLGYGFVTISDLSAALVAMEKLDGYTFCGRSLRVRRAEHNLRNEDSDRSKDGKDVNSVHVRFSVTKETSTPRLITEDTLNEVFSPYGDVIDACIKFSKVDTVTGLQSGYGFVHFPSTQEGLHSCMRAADLVQGDDTVEFRCEVSKHVMRRFLKFTENKETTGATASAVSLNKSKEYPLKHNNEEAYDVANTLPRTEATGELHRKQGQHTLSGIPRREQSTQEYSHRDTSYSEPSGPPVQPHYTVFPEYAAGDNGGSTGAATMTTVATAAVPFTTYLAGEFRQRAGLPQPPYNAPGFCPHSDTLPSTSYTTVMSPAIPVAHTHGTTSAWSYCYVSDAAQFSAPVTSATPILVAYPSNTNYSSQVNPIPPPPVSVNVQQSTLQPPYLVMLAYPPMIPSDVAGTPQYHTTFPVYNSSEDTTAVPQPYSTHNNNNSTYTATGYQNRYDYCPAPPTLDPENAVMRTSDAIARTTQSSWPSTRRHSGTYVYRTYSSDSIISDNSSTTLSKKKRGPRKGCDIVKEGRNMNGARDIEDATRWLKGNQHTNQESVDSSKLSANDTAAAYTAASSTEAEAEGVDLASEI